MYTCIFLLNAGDVKKLMDEGVGDMKTVEVGVDTYIQGLAYVNWRGGSCCTGVHSTLQSV